MSPFHNFFWAGGACEPFNPLVVWDRETQYSINLLCSIGCSYDGPDLCWQSNVGTFKHPTAITSDEANLMGSKNHINVINYRASIPQSSQDYLTVPNFKEHGWAMLNIRHPSVLVGVAQASETPESYIGLPMVGFMVQDFVNTSVSIGGLPSASSYGGNFNHKHTRLISGGNVRP